MIAWRRATAANLRRNFARPALAGVAALRWRSRCCSACGSQPDALLMFVLAGFVLGGGRAGAVCAACARGARWRASRCRVALVSLVRRNRRRYGGYLVHAGMAVLFVGIAASSSFQDERDVAAAARADGRASAATTSRT